MHIFIDLVYCIYTLMQLAFLHLFHFNLRWFDIFALSFYFSLCSFLFEFLQAVFALRHWLLKLIFIVRGFILHLLVLFTDDILIPGQQILILMTSFA